MIPISWMELYVNTLAQLEDGLTVRIINVILVLLPVSPALIAPPPAVCLA